jgi:pteridine reductase
MSDSSDARVSLQGKVALVTGAAKRIGRAVALRLAKEGADVVVHYHTSRAEADEAVSEIKKLGGESIALQADLRSVAEIQHLIQRVQAELGRLDILVNNAANFIPGHVEDTTEEIWDSALDTNLKSLFFIAQAAAPLLKESRGVIVNFGDVGGVLAWPGYIAHCVSKAGVGMLTKCLAKALAPEVRVNAIAPGTITLPGDAPELEADYTRRAPLKRTGTAEDIAEALFFLVRSPFMTGQILIIDGGRTL